MMNELYRVSSTTLKRLFSKIQRITEERHCRFKYKSYQILILLKRGMRDGNKNNSNDGGISRFLISTI